VTKAEFLRTYQSRAPHIMWLFGAGASASAGIPTADQMIWDFKRAVYCSNTGVSVRSCPDLSDPVIRAKLQAYLRTLGGSPPDGSDGEYEHYFEAVHSSEADRRRYIEDMVRQARPSHGHLSLAGLLKLDKARLVWTTNFDRLVEDAVSTTLGSTTTLNVIQLDSASQATEALNEERWPLLIKLHGDYQSRCLKNTAEELQRQDANMRKALVEASARNGLAVVGYSGRDSCIMEVLSDALRREGAFPFGLFWFTRPGDQLRPKVTALMESASVAGLDAHVIEVDTFDELVSSLLLLEPRIPAEVQEALDRQPRTLTPAPMAPSSGRWPVVRLNALPVLSAPAVCRLVVCDIGGTAEVNAAVEAAASPLIATRRRRGVLAFGPDAEINRVFGKFRITSLDVYPIDLRRLRQNSAEHGLLNAGLARAVTKDRPLLAMRKGRRHMAAVAPEKSSDAALAELKRAAGGQLCGTLPNGHSWAEAAHVRLECRYDQMSMLYARA